jgi:hypothetical protein
MRPNIVSNNRDANPIETSPSATAFRFEIAAAYVIGIALPIMETIRRRTNFSEFAFYIDDYLMGGLLLWGAVAVTRRCSYANALLVAGWAVLCGGLWPSFFGQWMRTEPRDISGFSHGFVITIKGGAYLIAIVSLILSIKNCRKQVENK